MKASDPSLRDEVALSFRGRQRWMIILGWVFTMIFSVVGIGAAVAGYVIAIGETPSLPKWQFERTRDLILCTTLFLFASLAVALLKTWYWRLLDRNAILREIKRLEQQIAQRDQGSRPVP